MAADSTDENALPARAIQPEDVCGHSPLRASTFKLTGSLLQQSDHDEFDDPYSDDASSTASVSASILEYRTINGRTYHSNQGNAEYWYVSLPLASQDKTNPARGANDEPQNEALDIMSVSSTSSGEQPNSTTWFTNTTSLSHHVLTLLLDGKLHRAPIDSDIQKVLDVGTGTGLWAIDFGDTYPNAEVIGTDLSPIQPSWVPPNVSL